MEEDPFFLSFFLDCSFFPHSQETYHFTSALFFTVKKNNQTTTKLFTAIMPAVYIFSSTSSLLSSTAHLRRNRSGQAFQPPQHHSSFSLSLSLSIHFDKNSRRKKGDQHEWIRGADTRRRTPPLSNELLFVKSCFSARV